MTSLQSAPASLHGSQENLNALNLDEPQAASFTGGSSGPDGSHDAESGSTRSKGHRRTGSLDIDLLKAITERVAAESGDTLKERPPKAPRKHMRLALKNVNTPIGVTQNGKTSKAHKVLYETI